MNTNFLCVFDMETGGVNPKTCQLTQIAAVIINPRTLRLEPGGEFNSEIQPILDDEKAIAAGFDPISEEALSVTRKTREKLALAPPEKIVVEKFSQFIRKYNPSKTPYKAPIPCGYNIINYDMPIVERICEKYSLQYKGKQALFNNLYHIDMIQHFFALSENNPLIQSRKLGDCMDWLGMDKKLKENAHDALTDVKNTANMIVKMLHFYREIGKATDFKNAFLGKELLIK